MCMEYANRIEKIRREWPPLIMKEIQDYFSQYQNVSVSEITIKDMCVDYTTDCCYIKENGERFYANHLEHKHLSSPGGLGGAFANRIEIDMCKMDITKPISIYIICFKEEGEIVAVRMDGERRFKKIRESAELEYVIVGTKLTSEVTNESLSPGQALQVIWTEHSQIQVDVCDMYFGMTVTTCLSLTVFMEKGQISDVPWVKAVFDDGTVRMYNVAFLQGYSLKEEK